MSPLSNLKLYSAGNIISFLNLYIGFQIVFSTNQYISYRHLNNFFWNHKNFACCRIYEMFIFYLIFPQPSFIGKVTLPFSDITFSPSSFRSLVVLTKGARSHRHFVSFYGYCLVSPIPVAEWSQSWACGRWQAGIVGSKSAMGIDVCLLWVLCVVR